MAEQKGDPDYRPSTLGDSARRFFGMKGSDRRTTDIELPNRSGRTDPRLARTSRNPLTRLGQRVGQLSRSR